MLEPFAQSLEVGSNNWVISGNLTAKLIYDLDDAFGYWTLGIPDIQAIQSALVEELQLLEQARGKK